MIINSLLCYICVWFRYGNTTKVRGYYCYIASNMYSHSTEIKITRTRYVYEISSRKSRHVGPYDPIWLLLESKLLNELYKNMVFKIRDAGFQWISLIEEFYWFQVSWFQELCCITEQEVLFPRKFSGNFDFCDLHPC